MNRWSRRKNSSETAISRADLMHGFGNVVGISRVDSHLLPLPVGSGKVSFESEASYSFHQQKVQRFRLGGDDAILVGLNG